MHRVYFHALAYLVFSISLSAASASISLCVSGRQLALAPLVVRLRVVCMRVVVQGTGMRHSARRRTRGPTHANHGRQRTLRPCPQQALATFAPTPQQT